VDVGGIQKGLSHILANATKDLKNKLPHPLQLDISNLFTQYIPATKDSTIDYPTPYLRVILLRGGSLIRLTGSPLYRRAER
jgi:hypothetical protein